MERPLLVTVYVGNVRFSRPVKTGQLVEVHAQMVHTGRTSMDIHHRLVGRPQIGVFRQANRCLMVFVAVDDGGKPTPVPAWTIDARG